MGERFLPPEFRRNLEEWRFPIKPQEGSPEKPFYLVTGVFSTGNTRFCSILVRAYKQGCRKKEFELFPQQQRTPEQQGLVRQLKHFNPFENLSLRNYVNQL